MNLSPRDRVLTAMDHEEPDRVPLALGGGPYGIVDPLYLKLVDYLELSDPVPPFREGHSISYMDDRLLERLGTDMRYVYPKLLPNSPTSPGEQAGTFYDSYGQLWHQAEPYYYAGTGILSQIQPGDDISQVMSFPNPKDSRWMEGVADRAQILRQDSNYFITMRMVASHGPFQTACDLRGTEIFLKDLALNPEFAQELLVRISDLLVGLLHQAMSAGGEYFDMIEHPGDD
jgi:uroporphyrinogen decarboxylase